MTIHHHVDDANLLRYASGDLGEAFAVVTAAHLAMCDSGRNALHAAEEIGGALLDEQPGTPLSESALDAVMTRIDAQDAITIEDRPQAPADAQAAGAFPAPLSRLVGAGPEAVDWKRVGPGIWKHDIELASPSSGALFLLKIEPGRTVPEHGHGGAEMTLVLSGSYSDVFGRFGRGDVADLDEHVEHQPRVDSDEPCICLVATEAPTRFKGLFSRLLQPLVRI